MLTILEIAIGVLVALGVYYLWAFPFREKKTKVPEESCQAVLRTREIRSGADRTGRSKMGFNYVLTFETKEGQTLELYAYEEEYGALREGMTGNLTWQGRYFVSLEDPKKLVPLQLPGKLYDAIATWADEDFRTVNDQIEYLLTRWVQTRNIPGMQLSPVPEPPLELEFLKDN